MFLQQVLYATEDGFAVPEEEAQFDDGVPPPPHPDEVQEEYQKGENEAASGNAYKYDWKIST